MASELYINSNWNSDHENSQLGLMPWVQRIMNIYMCEKINPFLGSINPKLTLYVMEKYCSFLSNFWDFTSGRTNNKISLKPIDFFCRAYILRKNDCFILVFL